MSSFGTGINVFIWSPGRAILLDANSSIVTVGTTLKDLASSCHGKSTVVLIAHRGSLVRQLGVPDLPKEQVQLLLNVKLATVLPGSLQEYVCGFRLSKDVHSAAKLAVLGAVKTISVRRVYEEAKEAGLDVVALVPAPFGSWLAATSRGVMNGIVVTQEVTDLCLDVIVDGELKYSRFCLMPESLAELRAEVERTAQTAGVSAGTILMLGGLELPGSEREADGLFRFVSHPQNIEKQLFLLELPEHREVREKKKVLAVAQRAMGMAIMATIAWGFVLYNRQIEDEKLSRKEAIQLAIGHGENIHRRTAVGEAVRLRRSEHLINLAFDPAQTFGDIVAVLSQDSDDKSWITGLSLERGKPMTIRGQAKDGKTVSKFVSKLSAEPRFRDIKLIFVNKGQIHDSPIVQFAISGVCIGNLPFDREVSLEVKKR